MNQSALEFRSGVRSFCQKLEEALMTEYEYVSDKHPDKVENFVRQVEDLLSDLDFNKLLVT